MVQFSRFASLILCIQIRIHIAVWVSPFGHHGIIAFLPAPPRFSQAYTSFFAYHRQGIHLMHLFTWLYHWRTFWLRRYWRWLPVLLRFSNLIKLTALLCIVLAFCLSRTIDTIITQILVICLFLLSVPTPFSGCLKCKYCLLHQTAF